MIVVDTNIVAYFLIEGPRTPAVRHLRNCDPQWRLPSLWRHEFLNILATYTRQGGATFRQAIQIWKDAVRTFSPGEQVADLEHALLLATKQKVSAYDAQFISLAQALGVACITEDRKLQKSFPQIAISIQAFCATRDIP